MTYVITNLTFEDKQSETNNKYLSKLLFKIWPFVSIVKQMLVFKVCPRFNYTFNIT